MRATLDILLSQKIALAISELAKCSQRKRQAETDLERCIVIQGAPQIDSLDVSLNPVHGDYIVA